VPFVLLVEVLFHFVNLVPSWALLTLFLVGWVAHCNHVGADVCKWKEAANYIILKGITLINSALHDMSRC